MGQQAFSAGDGQTPEDAFSENTGTKEKALEVYEPSFWRLQGERELTGEPETFLYGYRSVRQ